MTGERPLVSLALTMTGERPLVSLALTMTGERPLVSLALTMTGERPLSLALTMTCELFLGGQESRPIHV